MRYTKKTMKSQWSIWVILVHSYKYLCFITLNKALTVLGEKRPEKTHCTLVYVRSRFILPEIIKSFYGLRNRRCILWIRNSKLSSGVVKPNGSVNSCLFTLREVKLIKIFTLHGSYLTYVHCRNLYYEVWLKNNS